MSLLVQIREMRPDLPSGIIPIGIAGNGDRICLQEEDGAIYLWDHEREYSTMPVPVQELARLATDIDEFLAALEGASKPAINDRIADIGGWGDISALEEFLKSGGDINMLSTEGAGIVKYAAYQGHLDFIRSCLMRGASLRGASHAAVFSGHMSLVEFLLEQGVDPNEIDERGRRPLEVLLEMVYRRRGPLVQRLEKAGAQRRPQPDDEE